eukprot:scaffold43165_cov20-Tisochrysis_lutea.AAC.1
MRCRCTFYRLRPTAAEHQMYARSCLQGHTPQARSALCADALQAYPRHSVLMKCRRTLYKLRPTAAEQHRRPRGCFQGHTPELPSGSSSPASTHRLWRPLHWAGIGSGIHRA